MLPKRNRISNRWLIQKIMKQGEAYKTNYFVFKYLPSHLPDSKFAFLISKKVAAKAVRRNKLRRQLSESLRLKLNLLKNPIVCLVIQKKNTPQAIDYTILDAQVAQFLNHL